MPVNRKVEAKTYGVTGWLVPNTLMGALLVLGIVFGHLWAWRIFEFLTWFITVCYITMVTDRWNREIVLEQEVTVPKHPLGKAKWITCVTDWFMALGCVVVGHWLIAAVLILQQYLEQEYFRLYKPEELEDGEEPPNSDNVAP